MSPQAFHDACMALPAATMTVQWGDDHVYKVGGKMFAIVSGEGGLSFKVSDIAFQVLTEDGRAQPAPYLARAKWVHLEDPADWPGEELADHLRIAHGIIAGKLTRKVRAELGLS